MSEPNFSTVSIASGDPLDVRSFTIEQGMSRLFSISVQAVTQNLDIDFDEVIGKPAAFGLRSQWASPVWSGLCREIEQIRVDRNGLATYNLTVVPQLWLLTQRSNYRIFQMMTELDIVQKLLSEWGVSHELRVDAGAYKKRKYRVQYAETDFAFVSRMLEDAGVSYFFEDTGGASKMILDDAPQARGPSKLPIRFFDEPDNTDGEFVTKVAATQRVRPGRVTIGDVDYRRPSENQPRLSAAAGLPQEQALEQFLFEPGAFLYGAEAGGRTPTADDRGTSRTDEGMGARKTQHRLHGARKSGKVVGFESNAIDLVPGAILSVLDHPHRLLAAGAGLLVVGARIQGVHNQAWRVTVEAEPTSSPHHPEAVTPRPKVPGLESATVVGPSAEEIHTDEYGRVRCHFHWDRESGRNEQSSCWIPVSQNWAGGSFGGVNLPRVGQEVLVEFLGGDPDRPIVIGRVYTEVNGLHNQLPRLKTVSGLVSESSPRMVMGASGDGGAGPAPQGPGGGEAMPESQLAQLSTGQGPTATPSPSGSTHSSRSNALLMDDRAGRENLYLQAQRDMHTLVKNQCTSNIGHYRGVTVGSDDFLHVVHQQDVTIGADQNLTVGGNQTIRVTGNVSETVTGALEQEVTEGIKVTSKKQIDVTATTDITVKSDTKIRLEVKGSYIEITEHEIIIQSGDMVHINPAQGLQEAQEAERRRNESEAQFRQAVRANLEAGNSPQFGAAPRRQLGNSLGISPERQGEISREVLQEYAASRQGGQ